MKRGFGAPSEARALRFRYVVPVAKPNSFWGSLLNGLYVHPPNSPKAPRTLSKKGLGSVVSTVPFEISFATAKRAVEDLYFEVSCKKKSCNVSLHGLATFGHVAGTTPCLHATSVNVGT